MRWTISNILTLLRVALIPVIVAVYLGGASGYLTAGVFLLAGLTDWADGFLARQRNEESPFGAFLDPVADKLMVSAVLVLMAADPQMREHVLSPGLFTVIVAIIIGREITISALREWMAEQGKRDNVKVGMVGKIKTFCQMSCIFFLLVGAQQEWSYILGIFLIYIAAGLTLWSMVQYLIASWSHLFASEE